MLKLVRVLPVLSLSVTLGVNQIEYNDHVYDAYFDESFVSTDFYLGANSGNTINDYLIFTPLSNNDNSVNLCEDFMYYEQYFNNTFIYITDDVYIGDYSYLFYLEYCDNTQPIDEFVSQLINTQIQFGFDSNTFYNTWFGLYYNDYHYDVLDFNYYVDIGSPLEYTKSDFNNIKYVFSYGNSYTEVQQQLNVTDNFNNILSLVGLDALTNIFLFSITTTNNSFYISLGGFLSLIFIILFVLIAIIIAFKIKKHFKKGD